MTTLLVIEPCQIADFQAVANIYNEYIERGDTTTDETPKTAFDIEKWVQKFNDRERLYALKEGDQTIGWGIIKRYSDREGYRFTAETSVYLRSDKIGKGLGTYFKRFLIDECKRSDYHHLVAKIFASNTASLTYNQKLGYEVVGVQKQIAFKNGEWIDIVIMQLLLK